jgi:hypothetical protein
MSLTKATYSLINGAPVNVLDYGAVGDNVADDTAAIQAAVTYALASGSAVYFPEGVYRVSASINCGSRIKLFGNGFKSRINPTISNGTGVFNFPAASNFFSVEDLEVSSSVDFATYLAGGAPITGMNLVDYINAGVAMISADRVDGLNISGHVSRGIFAGPTVSTTANTKNFRQNIWSNGALNASPWLTDNSDQNGACFNYFPNRNFDMWFRGWFNVIPNRATLTQETSIVRKGANAAKITATAGQGFNLTSWTLTGDAVVALRGKTVVCGMWVFIPNIAEFSDDPATRTKFPSMIISSFNGSVAVDSTTRNGRGVKGQWQFMWNEVAVQSNATQIILSAYVNQSANLANGNEYIVVDSIILAEANTPFERLMNDDLPDSPMVPTIGVSGAMITRASAVPSDPDQVYAVGDIVWNTAVAAAGSPGWVCTTAGVGGVAVFKAMANVAA